VKGAKGVKNGTMTEMRHERRRATPRPATGRSANRALPAELQPLTRSLPEQIASTLSARIVSGAYQPGERIMEQGVAAEFAVSRGPIREALRLLEKDGLVVILPRRGAQVTKLTVEEVREIFDIRAALHGLRARLIAEDPDRTRILDTLKPFVEQLPKLCRDSQHADEYVETSFKLSSLMTASSGNKRLTTIMSSLALQTLRYTRLGLSTPQRRKQSAHNWQLVTKAIRDGDATAAEKIGRQLVVDSRNAAIRELQKLHGGE
jgi:DNA-binding GntR family transcriptional regulator